MAEDAKTKAGFPWRYGRPSNKVFILYKLGLADVPDSLQLRALLRRVVGQLPNEYLNRTSALKDLSNQETLAQDYVKDPGQSWNWFLVYHSQVLLSTLIWAISSVWRIRIDIVEQNGHQMSVFFSNESWADAVICTCVEKGQVLSRQTKRLNKKRA